MSVTATRSEPLIAFETPYSVWTEAREPGTGLAVPGQAAQRFYRFERPARLHKVVIPVRESWMGPEKPALGGEPRHVRITAYTESLDRPDVVFDGEVPAARETRQAVIELPGVEARAVSLWCDEIYPIEASLDDFATYYISRYFQSATWYGEPLEGPLVEPPWQKPLTRGKIEPRAVDGQQVTQDAYEVRFTSRWLSVGISLKRPLLRFMAWDAFGSGRVTENALYERFDKRHYTDSRWGNLTGGNGPYLYDLLWDGPPFGWTGTVEVEGNVVRYRGLHLVPGLAVDAELEVGKRDFALRLTQDVTRQMRALDAAAWGFVFDGEALHSIAPNAMPARSLRRGGGIEPNGGWAVFGNGMLDFTVEESSAPVAMQVDSTLKNGGTATAGIQLGTRHEPDGTVRLLPSRTSATMRFSLGHETPIRRRGSGPLPKGIHRGWGSIFAFRPEDGGFSNTGFGSNCQNCLYAPADMAAYTALRPGRADMLELVRYTATVAVQGCNGYGCQWEMLMDSAPSLAVSIARLHQVRPNLEWLRRQWVFLKRPLEFILANLAPDGLYTSRRRSGNSGSCVWSTIAMDCIGFGHQDGYSNALAYRALRGGVALARDAGDPELARRCKEAAGRLREAYAPALTNPETGLVAGWRSADGELHDHAYTYVNGMAICFGLVDDAHARRIVQKLEEMRLRLELDSFRYGMPTNLLPIPRRDHTAYCAGFGDREDGRDCFGMYINGSLSICMGYFYLRALSVTGFTEAADQACRELLESFEQGRFEGRGRSNALEWISHEGLRTGGEGTITHGYYILLAIAQHLKLVQTLEPEWWPA